MKPYTFEIKTDKSGPIRVEADSIYNIHCFDKDGNYLPYESLDLYLKSEIIDIVETHFFHLDAEKSK